MMPLLLQLPASGSTSGSTLENVFVSTCGRTRVHAASSARTSDEHWRMLSRTAKTEVVLYTHSSSRSRSSSAGHLGTSYSPAPWALIQYMKKALLCSSDEGGDVTFAP